MLRILSDLHLEFGSFKTTFSADHVNILAGDITVRDFDWFDNIPNLVYIAGNHEYYTGHIDMLVPFAREKECVTVLGEKFFCTTLWSDIDYTSWRGLNDKVRIKGWNMYRAQMQYKECLSWLLDQDLYGHVVVTHHAPSFYLSDLHFPGSAIKRGFASDLTSLILDKKPRLWIHGHMHNSGDYMIGDTRVICNPRGYAGYELNPDFKEFLVV